MKPWSLRLPILAAACLATAACGLLTSVDWERVAVLDADGGTPASGSSADTAPSDATPAGDAGGDETSGGDGANCSAPVDMFIMFDRSGSMGDDCDIGGTTPSKWCRATNAVSGYFNSAGAAGQAAALQFFPFENHTAALCGTGEGYQLAAMPSTPPPAYLALPTTAFDSLLTSAAPTTTTGSGTPTEAAIRGITRFTAANRRGGRVTIGILVTDGDPNGCAESLSHLSDLLAEHHAATQLRTYVIGMQGADFVKIETIAQGGNAPLHPDTVPGVTDACGNGAGPCRHWNVGDGDPAQFGAALVAIQDSADGCGPGGGVVNP